MKLERALVREIKTLTGNGSREAKFALLKRIDAAKKDLSTIKVHDTFNDCLYEHGRAIIAVCVAATLDARKERLDYWKWDWSREVLKLLPMLTPGNLARAYIDDGIHPTTICDYAGNLIRLTTEE